VSGVFFDSFNVSLPDMEAQFTEDWTSNGATWPAIAIDTLDEETHVIKGGVLVNVHCKVLVRNEVFEASGVQIGSPVSCRDSEFVIASIQSDGDASKTLMLAPRGIDVWK
jgi:hypothetical protein